MEYERIFDEQERPETFYDDDDSDDPFADLRDAEDYMEELEEDPFWNDVTASNRAVPE